MAAVPIKHTSNSNDDHIDEQQAINNSINAGVEKMKPVVKVVNQAKTIAASFIPGGSSYQEFKKSNYAMAAAYGAVDLFGGEVVDGAGKLLAKVVGEDALKATGKAIATFLEDANNISFKGSFEKGSYKVMEAQEDMVVYRFSGGKSSAAGGEFFSTGSATSSADAEKMLNINFHGNTGEEMTPVTIKKGTQFAIGKVDKGNGIQIFIPSDQQTKNVVRHLDLTVTLKPR